MSELGLTEEQFTALESIAVARSVNTRFLLTVAKLENASVQFPTYQEWLKWLYLETSRIRASLGPFNKDNIPIIQFRDGLVAYMQPETTSSSFWALVTILGAGKTLNETEQALKAFYDTYNSTFAVT